MVRRLFMLALLSAFAGCLWRSYGTILSVHLDVLTQMADKLCDTVASGRGPTAEGMSEYVYPAQRGREFLHQFSGYRERPSYQRFATFLDQYEAMVRDVDATRAQGGDGKARMPQLSAERDALLQLAAEIRADAAAGK